MLDGDDRHAVLLELGDEVLSVPRVRTALSDVQLDHELVDARLDVTVVGDVAGRGVEPTLRDPLAIWDARLALTLGDGVGRHPELRPQVEAVLRGGQHGERRQIPRGRQIEPEVDAAAGHL